MDRRIRMHRKEASQSTCTSDLMVVVGGQSGGSGRVGAHSQDVSFFVASVPFHSLQRCETQCDEIRI